MSKLEDILNAECTIQDGRIIASERLETLLTQHLLFEKANRKYERQRGSKGFIYLIKDADGYFKIGRATNLQVRLRKYYSENARPVELIDHVFCEDYIQRELDLHEKYKEMNFRAEWFNLNDRQVEEIKAIFKEWNKF